MPNEEARARIMQIHARKMTVSPKVNFEELARSTDEFNGCVWSHSAEMLSRETER